MKNLSLELLLAALIDQNDGELFLGREFLKKDYAGQMLAITPDPARDGIKFELIEEDDVIYDDTDDE